jgi:hypothetical protein
MAKKQKPPKEVAPPGFARVDDYLDENSLQRLPYETIYGAETTARSRMQQRELKCRNEPYGMCCGPLDPTVEKDWRTLRRYERVAGYGPGKMTINQGDIIVKKE